jgi:hypothetical protein
MALTPPNQFTPHDSPGTVLNLFGVVYTVTNIVISSTNPSTGDDARIDVAHLGQTTGEVAARMDRPLIVPDDTGSTGRQVTFDYLGKTIILDAATGTMSITVGGTTLIAAKPATVQSSTLTLATNDAIRGQATITIAR